MSVSSRVGLRVVPGANRAAVVGRYGTSWKISVTAPPEDGKANDAVVRLLAETLALPRSAVSIVHGRSGRDKVALVAGISGAVADERLANAVSGRAPS